MVRSRILVTGATGFIGTRLLRMLEQRRYAANDIVVLGTAPFKGHPTIVVGRDRQGLYDFEDANLEFASDGFEAIIHLGAFTPRDGSQANAFDLATTNIINTKRLIDYVPAPSRFIFASTLDVYGLPDGPLSEHSVPNPRTLYGAGKLYCEQMLRCWANQTETNLTVARIGHIYGPGEAAYRKFIPETIRRLKTGQPPNISSFGTERRSFMFIDDCCDALVDLIERGRDIAVVNIASSRTPTIADVASSLVEIAQDHGVVVPHWRPENGFRAADAIVDVTLLNSVLTIDEVDLEVGLRREFEAFSDV